MKRGLLAALLLSSAGMLPGMAAQAQTVAELQRQINELKAMIAAFLTAGRRRFLTTTIRDASKSRNRHADHFRT